MSRSGASADSKPSEIRALAGARALPPLLLVLYHYHEAHGYQQVRLFDVFVAKGYLWVEFFFALSGFILVHVYAARARRIHMHQNKSAEREEELDPQVTLGHEHVEQPDLLIAVRFVIMVEHEQKRRQRARAGQRANLGRL